MKIKRYFAADMRQALQMVREEQGPDAVILSNRKVDGGVEIVAAIDYDPAAVERLAREEAAKNAATVGGAPSPRMAAGGAAASSSVPEQAVPTRGQRESRSAATTQPVVWSQDPSITAMRDEIKTLRGLLETQLSGFAWSETRLRQPLRAQLLERLTRLGLSPRLSRELADSVRLENDAEHNWRQALGQLSRRISVTDDDILSHGGVVALVGPTGVGKTTTVAKLAARYRLRHGANRVALVTTDMFRIGAQQQLRTFGRILGAPVFVAHDAAELSNILESLRDKSLVLIDTAGLSQRDVRLNEQLAMLRSGRVPVRTYGVFSTTAQRAALDETLRAFGALPLAGCILTKLDESASLGESLSVVAQHGLPVAYIADGQRVPEDLQPARANNLVTRSVALVQNVDLPTQEAMAFSFGSMVSSAHG
jgi:flagellar biosynthesis protein FlhF